METLNTRKKPEPPRYATMTDEPQGSETEATLAINGLAQVIEMLKVADAPFRESILRRLASRDRNLANTLRVEMKKLGL